MPLLLGKVFMKRVKITHYKYKKETLITLITLIPIFLYHFLIIVLPSFNNLYSSFTNWNGLGTKELIGFANYREMFNDPNFYIAFRNNIKWMIIFLIIPIIAGVVIGYILSTIKKGALFFKASYFLPYVISSAIAGKIFATFYNPYFGINVALEALHLDFLTRDWLAPSNALFSVAFVDMWHWWGFVLVLIMSALQQIDPMLYESADVEGCNDIQKIWHITLPSIKTTLVFIILATMVWSINTYDYVWVMTKGAPGSELLSTMLYKNAMLKYRGGYACSISVVQTFIGFIFFAIFGLIRKRLED